MQWQFDQTSIDWVELSNLYRIAPQGTVGRPQEDHPVRESREGRLLQEPRLHAHAHGHGHLQGSSQAIRGGLVEET
jgi:hypothetical protein